MTAATTRVAILSPHEIVVRGLAAMLARHPDRVEVVGEHQPGEDDSDVVVFDLALLVDDEAGTAVVGATGPAELARLVRETSSAVLVVARELRPDLVGRATALGVDGVTLLGVDHHELLAAVEAASTGLHAPEPGDGRDDGDDGRDGGDGDDGVVPATPRPAAAAVPRLGGEVGLTDREVDVLRLVTYGLTNDEIAQRTFLSINSVKTYIRSAYRRLGVTTRSQAVVWCLQHGFPARPEQAGAQIVATDPESTR